MTLITALSILAVILCGTGAVVLTLPELIGERQTHAK